jgi:flagellar biosynthesis/type III secretory pathway protein FliH
MKTIRLPLKRQLKNARLLSLAEFGSILTAAAGPEATKALKLTATESDELAKSRLLADQESAELCARLAEQVELHSSTLAETIEQFRELLIQMAMEIAAAVVRYEVSEHETRIRELLQEYITDQDSKTQIVAYVNKLDLERLQNFFGKNSSLNSKLQLKFDPNITQGDVRIETADRRVIASCQQQLASIQLQLMEYLSDARLKTTND